MYCPNCGAQIADNSTFCPKCGARTNSDQPYTQPGTIYDKGYSQSTDPNVTGFDWLTTLLLCWFLGVFGVHSFYTKKTGIGIAQLLTLGGCGIWTLVDFIMILLGSYRDGYDRPLVRKN